MRVEGLRFGVWCSGSRMRKRRQVGRFVQWVDVPQHLQTFDRPVGPFPVQGSGFRVQGSGCRVQGAGFRVQDLGYRPSRGGCAARRSRPTRDTRDTRYRVYTPHSGLQGYLAHKKQLPPRVLQYPYAYGPMSCSGWTSRSIFRASTARSAPSVSQTGDWSVCQSVCKSVSRLVSRVGSQSAVSQSGSQREIHSRPSAPPRC